MKKLLKLVVLLLIVPVLFFIIQLAVQEPVTFSGIQSITSNIYLQVILLGFLFDLWLGILFTAAYYVIK